MIFARLPVADLPYSCWVVVQRLGRSSLCCEPFRRAVAKPCDLTLPGRVDLALSKCEFRGLGNRQTMSFLPGCGEGQFSQTGLRRCYIRFVFFTFVSRQRH